MKRLRTRSIPIGYLGSSPVAFYIWGTVGSTSTGTASLIQTPIRCGRSLINSRASVLGTDLRKRAYHTLKAQFPQSLALLEIGRIAAWTGSDLGNVCGFLLDRGVDFRLEYWMNMEDAEDAEFLGRLKKLRDSDHLRSNWADLLPHIDNESSGAAPDFRAYGFSIVKAAS